MLRKKSFNILLLFILVLAFFLRSYRIDKILSLNPDEAALGYNAYSLLKTGRDEHGISWPLHFKSFGDYKPGGYVYLLLPFINLLGLNEFSVRLPNLIASVLSIYVFYLLICKIFSSQKLALISAFVLAVNPWHIHFSRGAWESSVASFLILLGIYLFFSWKDNQKLILGYVFPLPFVASLYIYHSARVIAPLLVISLLVINSKLIIKHIYRLTPSFLIAALLVIPVTISFLNNGGTSRFSGVGIFSDYGPISRSEELLNHHMSTLLPLRVIHNKRFLYAVSFAQKYTSHFNFNFLFVNGDEVPRSKSPELGQFHIFEFIPFLIGIYFIFNTFKISTSNKLFIALFTLITPLGSSLTYQAPSALRALPLVYPLTIFVAYGIYKVISNYKILIYPLVILYIYFTSYSFDSYFIHAPLRYSYAWNSGFSQIIPQVNALKDQYQNIYFTNKYDQPYILYLFYSQYDPKSIQSQIKLTPPDKYGFSTVEKIDNITFNIPSNIPPGSLIVADSDFQKTGQSFTIYTK